MRYLLVGILLFALAALAGPQQTQDKGDWFSRNAPKSALPAYSDCLPWLIQESERTKAREAETSGMVMGWKDAEVADLRRQLREANEKREELSRRNEALSRETSTLKAMREVGGGSGYVPYVPPPRYSDTVWYTPAPTPPPPSPRSLHCTSINLGGGIISTQCN